MLVITAAMAKHLYEDHKCPAYSALEKINDQIIINSKNQTTFLRFNLSPELNVVSTRKKIINHLVDLGYKTSYDWNYRVDTNDDAVDVEKPNCWIDIEW